MTNSISSIPWSITEQLLYTTCRIDVRLNSGKQAFGTGFIFDFRDDSTSVSALVTNRHVLHDAKSIEFKFHVSHEMDEALLPLPNSTGYELDLPNKLVAFHSNSEIDLCAILLPPIVASIEADGAQIYLVTLSKENIFDQPALNTLSAMVPITMPGHPIGLSDTYNNLPILRRGVTAFHPALNYDGKPEGVVDIGCFAGSSGSPVVIAHEQGPPPIKPLDWAWGSPLFVFLGVLHEGPVIDANNRIGRVPIAMSEELQVKTPIHLGYYIKAEQVIEMQHDVFEAKRVFEESQQWSEPSYQSTLPLTIHPA